MKKIILILIIAFFGSGAFAQDLHFGAKLAFDLPQFTGVFLRIDDTDRSQRGFGARFTLGGLYLLTVGIVNGEVNGYYRFARQPDGSGAYVGGGIGFYYAFSFGYPGSVNPPVLWYMNGLLGYEFQIGDGAQFFIEIRPTTPINTGTSGSTIGILPLFGFGFLFEF